MTGDAGEARCSFTVVVNFSFCFTLGSRGSFRFHNDPQEKEARRFSPSVFLLLKLCQVEMCLSTNTPTRVMNEKLLDSSYAREVERLSLKSQSDHLAGAFLVFSTLKGETRAVALLGNWTLLLPLSSTATHTRAGKHWFGCWPHSAATLPGLLRARRSGLAAAFPVSHISSYHKSSANSGEATPSLGFTLPAFYLISLLILFLMANSRRKS